jgi:hypothetical protein
MSTNRSSLALALFGVEILHATWMKTHTTIARLAESDEGLYNALRDTDKAVNSLESALRARLRGAA